MEAIACPAATRICESDYVEVRPLKRSVVPPRTMHIRAGWAEDLVRDYSHAGEIVVNVDGLPAIATAAARLGRRSVNLAASEGQLNQLCLLRETALPLHRRNLMRIGLVRPEKAATVLPDSCRRPSQKAALAVVSTSRAEPTDRLGLLPAIRRILRPDGHLATLRIAHDVAAADHRTADVEAVVPLGTLVVVTPGYQLPTGEFAVAS
ncbi:hypothetical protein [Fodinicola acaciae]|uniref:hypothetical protein n=1 Tax=Fodinicola acaciae TaxID=2681555 RepID=UPI0013D8BC3F|nr:hypothetical protein [Fodinicola acaciae]